jgi:alkylation response protein AidB-like acyl-CoA dehydrogenase
MALILSEEQKLLKDSATEFLAMNAPVEQFRDLRDNNYKAFDESLWTKIVEMGWTALTIPEEFDGLEFGYVGLGQILEEMGKNLTKAPLFSSIVLGANALTHSKNQELKKEWLPQLMEGTKRVALALDEHTYFDPTAIATTAKSTANGYTLSGKKTMIIDGASADAFIVVAKTEDEELALFIVAADSKGITVTTDVLLDAGTYATVVFDQVAVTVTNRISGAGEGAALLNHILNTASICLSAEMLGMVTEAFGQTVAYLKEREQFGKRIGTYQALQHRAAIMFSEIELCKSIVIQALQALDSDANDLDQLASLAKAKLGKTIKLVTNEAMQMHGGIGVTDDVNIGFYFKRARVLQRLFGDYNFHLDRYARLNNY